MKLNLGCGQNRLDGHVNVDKFAACSPGATVKLAVLHPRSDSYAGDPTHVRAITPAIMLLLSKKNNLEWKQLEKVQTGQMTDEEINFAANHYSNVVDELQITLLACKPALSAPPADRATADVA